MIPGGSGGGEDGPGLGAGLVPGPGLAGAQAPGLQPGLQVLRGGGQAAHHRGLTGLRINYVKKCAVI